MPTPEFKVKNEVKKILARYGTTINGFWPVPSGYGESHLDYVGCCNGYFISIETKAPGKKPTPRQLKRMEDVRAAGGIAVSIDGTDKLTSYAQLEKMLTSLAGAPSPK